MKAILFEPGATDFSTNGIGRIECLSGYVTEAKNGQYELEAVVPETGRHVKDIDYLSILCVRHDDSEDLQPFRVYEIKKPINGKITIYAQHISYQLAKIPTMPFDVPAQSTSCGQTLELLKSNAVEDCPFTFWTDIRVVASYQQAVPASIWSRLKGTEGSVLDQFGGEYEWDKWTVKLHRARGVLEPTVSLRYGKNIVDINQEKNIASTITGVCPYWTNAEGTLVTLPEKVIESDYADRYPFRLTVPLDLSQYFETQPTLFELRAAARAYITKKGIGLPKVSIKVSFVHLWQTEEYKNIAPMQRLKLCDYVNIDFERFNISEQAQVVKTCYDFVNERYESMELGDIRSTIASTITDLSGAISAEITRNNFELRKATNELKGDIDNATAWLTDSHGYVMAVKNEDGTWKETLYLDHPDASQAIRVLRINENGIGFSSRGVEGPYTQAWTLDGRLIIGGTNVPSFTVYKGDGTILFKVFSDGESEGIQWNTPNSVMLPNGSLTLKGGSSVNASTLTGTINGDTVGITNINGGNIKTGTIDADQIKAGAITTAKLNIGAVTAEKIAANTITSDKIQAGAITADKIAAKAISASKIQASAITAEKIAAGTITSDKISASGIKGDKIVGGTITGVTITSTGTHGNITLNDGWIHGTNISCTQSLQCPSSGMFSPGGSNGMKYAGADFWMHADMHADGYVKPLYANTTNCGTSNYYWAKVCSKKFEEVSDRNKKKNIKPIPEIYEKWFLKLKPVEFMFKDGDRIHLGAIAQDIEEALADCGMTDKDFGGYDKSLKMKLKDPIGYDEEDNPIYERDEHGRPVEEPDLDEHGNKQYDYGLCYTEFIMLNTHMLQKAYESIERLEAEIESLKAKEG